MACEPQPAPPDHADLGTAPSKGERLVLEAHGPNVAGAELPVALRVGATLTFDAGRYDLRRPAAALLGRSPFGRFADGDRDCQELEKFQASISIFRSFQERARLRDLVTADAAFLAAYERLVIEVVLPWLKASLEDRCESCFGGQPVSFSYQYPPTLRVQPGASQEFKRPHRDLEYGHQVGELNFWMPLTDYSHKTRTTLWVESFPGAGDYSPLEVDPGEIAVFHGTLCRHHVPANGSPFTRVSMDFRVGVGDFFDSEWQLPGVKAIHGRRAVCL